jgi:hypothetical protein
MAHDGGAQDCVQPSDADVILAYALENLLDLEGRKLLHHDFQDCLRHEP